MDWTRKKSLFLTFDLCDLDLEATVLGLARDILSHNGQHFCQVISKSTKKWQNYRLHTTKILIFDI